MLIGVQRSIFERLNVELKIRCGCAPPASYLPWSARISLTITLRYGHIARMCLMHLFCWSVCVEGRARRLQDLPVHAESSCVPIRRLSYWAYRSVSFWRTYVPAYWLD